MKIKSSSLVIVLTIILNLLSSTWWASRMDLKIQILENWVKNNSSTNTQLYLIQNKLKELEEEIAMYKKMCP